MARCPFCNEVLRAPAAPTAAPPPKPERCVRCSGLLPPSGYCRRCNLEARVERPLARCERCGQPYAPELDGCPRCAPREERSPGVGPVAASPYRVAAGPAATVTQESITGWIIASIFALLCCCTPLGIACLVYSVQAQTLLRTGDVEGAARALGNVRSFFIAALVLGIIAVPLYILATLADIASSGGGY